MIGGLRVGFIYYQALSHLRESLWSLFAGLYWLSAETDAPGLAWHCFEIAHERAESQALMAESMLLWAESEGARLAMRGTA